MSPRVLYMGVYRDGTGYGNMALNSILALDAAGVDVVARPIKLNKTQVNLPQRILELEEKPSGNFDAVIQNLLPHMIDYCGKIPTNIVYYCTETSRFDDSTWPGKINCMDRAWVCNSQSKTASITSGVTIPVRPMPIACDITKYQRKYKPLSIRQRLGDSFIFYYIGEFNKRKNIATLLKAFHLEFDVNEPVHLLLKTDIPGSADDDYERTKSREQVQREIQRVKGAMKLYRSIDQYKEEILLIGRYTDEEIMRLHASCDCFVSAAYGEAWCIPAFDAMAMGKTPVCPNWGGFAEYLGSDLGWMVEGQLEPVYGMNHGTFDDIFTSRENWYAVGVDALRIQMRLAYESRDKRQEKAIAGRKRAYDFSYNKVGTLMKGALEANGL